MKKTLNLLVLVGIALLCIKANAKTYDICKTGCTYDNAQDVFYEIQYSTVEEDVVILFKDSRVYHVDFDASFGTYGNQNQYITGYSENTYITNITIKSEDPNNRATLESGQNQFSFEYDNAENFIIENMIMKNMETDNSFHGGDMFFVQEKNIYLKNSDFYTQDCFAFWSSYGEVKDCYFYSEDGVDLAPSNHNAGKLIVDNIKVDTVNPEGYFVIDAEEMNVKNVYVNTKNDYGCTIYSKNATIDNINIKGATIAGIFVNYFDKDSASKVTIKNSDLSENELSILSAAYNYGDEYDIKISHSKMNGAKSFLTTWNSEHNNNNRPAQIIYIDSSNTWTKTINREENIIEENDGRVIIDFDNVLTVNMSNIEKDNLNLEKIFENVESFDFNNVEWTSSDSSVATIEGKEIKILKIGETTITGSYDGNNYNIQLKVTNEMINPKTKRSFISLVILFLCISMMCIRNIIKKTSKMEV